MTNLERARQSERLKVRRVGDKVYIGVNGSSWLFDEDYLENWVNEQIDHAVTHAIDDTEEPELWRDLAPDDIIQEGDRILIDGSWHLALGFRNNAVSYLKSKIAQRRVRKEEE